MPQRPIRRGDVYWATYAFPHERDAGAGEDVEKQRPLLVVQCDADNQNAHYPLVLAAPITTQKTERIYEQDVLLPPGEANLQQASEVLLGLTQPFLETRLGQRIARVSPARMREVDFKLLRLMGFVKRAK
jgi:mRNA-degrading endonuclease toxin of MazEF toxin-antitoxin module